MKKWPSTDIFKYLDKAVIINQTVDRLVYYKTPESAITPGASPYVYQNDTDYDQDIIVSGGTVSAITFSRDGAAYYATGIITGMFRLSPLDYLKTTYTVAPTMTKVPR